MLNYQEKLGRINRPRVNIYYTVETEGAQKKVELPFVFGVITNLSGDTSLENKREPNFVNVDNDNLDYYLSKQEATLVFTVPNIITNQGNIAVNLKMTTRASFEILEVVKQIPELNVFYNKIHTLSKIGTMVSNNAILSDFIKHLILQDNRDNIITALKEKMSTFKS